MPPLTKCANGSFEPVIQGAKQCIGLNVATLKYRKLLFGIMKKYLRIALYIVLPLLVLAQLYRPARNLSDGNTYHISTQYPVPSEVGAILETACYDCHSNKTRYPWYANIQPVASWLAHHVEEGKDELNFSEFTKRRVAVQNHKFEEIIEVVKEGEMPLDSYTWMHKGARLSEQQRQTLTAWAQSNMDMLRTRYPADSFESRHD